MKTDLFESPELLPKNVRTILENFGECGSYERCKELQEKIKLLGYSFEYGLDGEPHSLAKTKNTYQKFAPNVFVAKCEGKHEKGEIIQVTTQYGKENDSIVFNFIGRKDGFYFYSIVRADGFNVQEWAKRRAEKLQNASLNADKKSDQYYKASNEGAEFLSLAEPIKIGHHSEKKHRALIERNHNRMGKSVEFSKKSEEYKERAKYWESKTNEINLSMPESLEYYEYKLEEAKMKHEGLKDGIIERSHSYSLTYAKKDVKELEKKLTLAKRLWA